MRYNSSSIKDGLVGNVATLYSKEKEKKALLYQDLGALKKEHPESALNQCKYLKIRKYI